MHDASAALQTLEQDLRAIFGSRLQSVVRYGVPASDGTHDRAHGHREPVLVHVLAVVDSLTSDDLSGCAKCITTWHDAGAATPLIMPASELARSLDVFPFELSAILADHTVISGKNPFEGLLVEPSDLRWACEVQARSHLLHLRQGFVEARGRNDALAVLIVRSAAAWTALLQNVARLEDRPVEADDVTKLAGVKEISNDEAARMFPPYLARVEALTSRVDAWK